MARLTVEHFNQEGYWRGEIEGGYADYQDDGWIIHPDFGGTDITNHKWYQRAKRFIEHGGLVGLRVLDLGCATGGLVRVLRGLGADAYGLDLSYPISQGVLKWPELEPYLIVADARDYLADPTLEKNLWDVTIGSGFWECFPDEDTVVMIPRVNHMTKSQQIYLVDTTVDPDKYTQHSLEEWVDLLGKPPKVIVLD